MAMRPFGEIAVARGLVTELQVEAALDQQRAMAASGHEHIGALLARQGLLGLSQVQQVLELQGKRMLFCSECFAHFNVRDYREEESYRCRKCGETLLPPESSGDPDESGALAAARVERIEVESGILPLAGRAVLRVESGAKAGSELRVAEGETVHIGSREDVDFALTDSGVAGLHCKIRSNGLDVMIFDYEARGTTKVKGQPVDFLQLRAGDDIALGSVSLTVHRWAEPGEALPPSKEGEAAAVGEPSRDEPTERTRREVLVGRALVDRGLVTQEQINDALQEQDQRRREGRSVRLGELLVERKLVTEHQVNTAIRAVKNRRLHVRCPGCGTSFNLRQEDLGNTFPCFNCGKELNIPKNPLLLQPGQKEPTPFEAGQPAAPASEEAPRRQARPTQPVPLGDLIEAERAADALHNAETGEGTPIGEVGGNYDDVERPTVEVPPPRLSPEAAEAAVGDSSGDFSVPAPTMAEDESLVLELSIEVPVEEYDFCEVAYRDRFVTRVQLEHCLRLLEGRRERGDMDATLGEVLVAQRYLTGPHHHQILAKLGLQIIPVDIPGYQILGKLGEGASGTVYEALRLAGRRPVALKIVRPDFQYDERFVRRFYREAELAMRLAHPNIVAGVDVGQHGPHMYMVMELFVGETVEEYLMREKRMSERYALEIGYQVALALAHANSHSLIHRDVKPGNIVLDPRGVAKLIDLGLAKSVSGNTAQSVTQTGLILGTPNYISPEQARGDSVIDHRCDIYSLGASLYHMVTGELPFKGNSPLDTMMMHLNDDPLPARSHTPEVSRVLSLLISRMMAKNPADRVQTWDEVAAKLETLLQR